MGLNRINRDDLILGWSQSQFPHDQGKLVRDLSWSRLYCLHSGENRAWTKVLHREDPSVIEKLLWIHSAFEKSLVPVIAANSDLNAIIFKDHGGEDLADEIPHEDVRHLVSSYADLQRGLLMRKIEMPDCIPVIEMTGLLDRFEEFLRGADRTSEGLAVAARFIGRDAAQAYADMISVCRTRLEEIILCAKHLPQVLCHCDLRPGNAARMQDGRFVFLDWDDATMGPAGLSLTGVLSNRASTILSLYTNNISSYHQADMSIIAAYMKALLPVDPLKAYEGRVAMAGSLISGLIHSAMAFGVAAPYHDQSTEASAQTIHFLLSDILNVCEGLIVGDPEASADLTKIYVKHGYFLRAAEFSRYFDDHTEYTRCLAKAEGEEAEHVAHILSLIRVREKSRLPETVPQLTLSEFSLASGEGYGSVSNLCQELFHKYGAFAITDLVKPETVENFREVFEEEYADYLTDREHQDALKVGDRRFMVTADIKPPLSERSLLMPPFLDPFYSAVLGEDFIIGSVSVVTSLPGAQPQWKHKDHPALFPELQGARLPEFAINMIIPLISLDDTVGSTCIFKGSHLVSDEEAEKMAPQIPHLPVGGALLISNRLTHFGMENRSNRPRSILCVNFHRAWFRDKANHAKQAPVSLSDRERAALSPDLQIRFL